MRDLLRVPVAKKDVQDLLKASGVSADDASLDVMMKKLEGKSIPELIAEGSKDLCASSSAGSGGAGPAAAADAAPAAEEKPKEEEKEEEVEDIGGLFGDEDDY